MERYDSKAERWRPAPKTMKVVEVWEPPSNDGAFMAWTLQGRGLGQRMTAELLRGQSQGQ